MVLAGGKRDRMIWLSLYRMVYDALEELGWFNDPVANDLDRQRVNMPWGGFSDHEPVPVNAIVVMPEDISRSPMETGSSAMFKNRFYTWEIYAEDHAVGSHLRGDIAAILTGEHPEIGRVANTLEVYDWDMATPGLVAVMDIEDVRDDRAKGGQEPWERYWYSILHRVEDDGDGVG